MNQRLTIAIDARALGAQRTGDEIYTRELIRHLIAMYPDDTYHLLFGITPNALPFRNTTNVHIHEILPERKGSWTLWAMPRALRAIQPDILHVQYTTPQWFSPLPKNTKIVTTIHDLAYKHHPEWIQWRDRALWNIFLGPSVKRADAVIAVSSCTAHDIQRFFPFTKEKTHVIENGVEERYRPIQNEGALATARKKYNLSEKFILYLGTLQPRKNIPTLIHGFEQFKIDHPSDTTKLVIAGNNKGKNVDPEINATLNTMAQAHQHDIIFPGYIAEEDKPALYNLAHLFVWPSFYEGFGLPPLEAAACGTPVIANDTPCHRDILGNLATIINMTPKLLAETIATHLKKGRVITKPERPYSWETCARKTHELYLSLVSAKRTE